MHAARHLHAAGYGDISLGHIPHLVNFCAPFKAVRLHGQGRVGFLASIFIQIQDVTFRVHPGAVSRGIIACIRAHLTYKAVILQRAIVCKGPALKDVQRALVCKGDARGDGKRADGRHVQRAARRVFKVPAKFYPAVHAARAALVHYALPVCFARLVANGCGPHHGAGAGNRKAAACIFAIAAADACASQGAAAARGRHFAARDGYGAAFRMISAADAGAAPIRAAALGRHLAARDGYGAAAAIIAAADACAAIGVVAALGRHHAARDIHRAAAATHAAADARAAVVAAAARGLHHAARDRHRAAVAAVIAAADARAGISSHRAARGRHHTACDPHRAAAAAADARAAADAGCRPGARGRYFAAMDGDAAGRAAGRCIAVAIVILAVVPADASAVARGRGRGLKAAHFAFLCALRIHRKAVAFAHFDAAVHGEFCAVFQNQVHAARHGNAVFNGNRATCHIPCLIARRAPFGVALLHLGRVFLRIRLAVFAQIRHIVVRKRRGQPHQRRKQRQRRARRPFGPCRFHPDACLLCRRRPRATAALLRPKAEEGRRGPLLVWVPAAAGTSCYFLYYTTKPAACPYPFLR